MIDINEIHMIGSGLNRPECILCTRAGLLYVSDWRGGVTAISPSGKITSYLAKRAEFSVCPNGIALLPDGSFLLAHLGVDNGGVFQLDRDGTLTPFLTEIDGVPFPPTNYVHLDHLNRVWITVSTRIRPRSHAYRKNVNDGFIILMENGNARIVADGLGYTNECHVDPSGKWLYVNETFARRLSRFTITSDSSLIHKETVVEFGSGVFPDGLTFDQEGGIWITSIVSNRVIRIDAEGKQNIILEDSNLSHVDWVEEAFQSGQMGRQHLDNVKCRKLQNISSLAFGGEDLCTAYLGCLLGGRIASFHSTIPGVIPVHWHFDD